MENFSKGHKRFIVCIINKSEGARGSKGETFRTTTLNKKGARSVERHQSHIDHHNHNTTTQVLPKTTPTHPKMSTVEEVWGNLDEGSTSSASRTSFGSGGSNSYSGSSWGRTTNSGSSSWGSHNSSSAWGKSASSVWGKLW